MTYSWCVWTVTDKCTILNASPNMIFFKDPIYFRITPLSVYITNYMLSLCEKLHPKNQSIKPIIITENISVWEKKCWGKALFKRPNMRLGKLLKPGKKFVWGQLWGQSSTTGPGQVRFHSVPFWARVPPFFMLLFSVPTDEKMNCGSFKRFNIWLHHTDKFDVNFAAITVTSLSNLVDLTSLI